MGLRLSKDLRERVVAAYERGDGGYTTVAGSFNIGRETLRRLVIRKRTTGSLEPDEPPKGFPPKLSGERLEVLRTLVADKPDLTAQELADELNTLIDVTVSRSGVIRALKTLGITWKKKPSEPRNKTARTSSSGARPTSSTSTTSRVKALSS